MWTFCVCSAWCWTRHPHTGFQSHMQDWNFLAEQLWIHSLCRDILKKPVACFLQWAAGANMCTLQHCKIYTGFQHTPHPMVPTAQFGQMDGLTLVQTGPGPVSGRILPYFRTPSGHPSAKKVRLKKKTLCILAVCRQVLPGKYVTQLSNAFAGPQLSVDTYPHACKKIKAKRGQKSERGRSKPCYQTYKRELITSCNHPKSRR